MFSQCWVSRQISVKVFWEHLNFDLSVFDLFFFLWGSQFLVSGFVPGWWRGRALSQISLIEIHAKAAKVFLHAHDSNCKWVINPYQNEYKTDQERWINLYPEGAEPLLGCYRVWRLVWHLCSSLAVPPSKNVLHCWFLLCCTRCHLLSSTPPLSLTEK